MTQTAKTYGDSLYELARDEKLAQELLPQLTAVVEIFEENPQFTALLQLPAVPKKERISLLDAPFSVGVHPYLLNFMKILTENGTIAQLPGCAQQFRKRYNQDAGILDAQVITAKPLGDDLMGKLQAKLQQTTGKIVELTQRIDPTVLGGIRLEMEGQMMDGTVKNRLEKLQTQLKNMVL